MVYLNIIIKVFYISLFIFDIFFVGKKIYQICIKNKTIFYFSNWIFVASIISAFLIYIIFYLDFFQNTIIKENTQLWLVIFMCIISLYNFFVTFGLYIGTKIHFIITDTSFIIYNFFTKDIIRFDEINVKESKEIHIKGKESKIFPVKNILSSKRFLLLKTKTGIEKRINLNYFLFNLNDYLLIVTIHKKLKIKTIVLSND